MAKVRTRQTTMGGAPMAVVQHGSGSIEYPESDGRPVAETEIHLRQLFDLYAALRQHFAGRPDVHVSCDLLLYYEEGKPDRCVAPDLMVIFGIPPGLRRTYKLWEERKAPEVVVEVTSRGTRHEDRGKKRTTYAMLRVSEYYMIDPTAEYLKPPLRAWRLRKGRYIEDISQPLVSPALGLELRLVDGRLRFADPGERRLLPSPDEYVQEIAAAEERSRLAEERSRLAEARSRQAEERARVLEAELASLRAKLGS